MILLLALACGSVDDRYLQNLEDKIIAQEEENFDQGEAIKSLLEQVADLRKQVSDLRADLTALRVSTHQDLHEVAGPVEDVR